MQNNDINTVPVATPRTSIERLQQLEAVNQELRNKNQVFEHENKYYKSLCQKLENDVNRMRSAIDDDTNSIAAINDPFVDVMATNLCEEIETCLEETNRYLIDEKHIKPAFEHMIVKLSSLVQLQYSSKDLVEHSRLKNELCKKLHLIDEKIQRSAENEQKIGEIKNAYERLKTELDSIKAANSCKQMVDSSQIDLLTNEFMKWKEEIRSLHSKVQEQNSLIQELTEKCKPLIDDKKSQLEISFNIKNNETLIVEDPVVAIVKDETKPIEIAKKEEPFDNVSPGTSPNIGFGNLINAYQSYEIINTIRSDSLDDNETVLPTPFSNFDGNQDNSNDEDNRTILPNINTSTDDDEDNRKSLQVHQCPFCSVAVSKDSVTFDLFVEHVNSCDNTQSTCIFCLKMFKKDKQNEFLEHVNGHVTNE